MSVLVFSGAWFLPTVEGSDGHMAAGQIWVSLFTRNYACTPGEMLELLAVTTGSFALVAAVVGWLLQFPVCIAWKYFHRRGRHKRSAS